MLNPCTLQGARQDLCIAIIGKGNRNRKIILLVDIIDVIIGSYPDDDIPMMAIVTKSLGTLNFQIPEDSESWIEALRKVLMFLQMPVSFISNFIYLFYSLFLLSFIFLYSF